MRAREFVIETKEGVLPKDQSDAMPSVHKSRDVGGYDRTNHLNRIMMAAAMADGKSKKPVDMDSASWIEKYNTMHPYTEEEHNMIHQAMATVPSEHKTVSKFGKSTEKEDTHKTSPVKGFKGYPR